MQRIHLGEFEELVLLIVAVMDGEAYGVGVMEELEIQSGRSVNISAIHAALRRLAQKGFVRSQWSKANAQRGGRRKRLFIITKTGMFALEKTQDTRSKLWTQISNISHNLTFS